MLNMLVLLPLPLVHLFYRREPSSIIFICIYIYVFLRVQYVLPLSIPNRQCNICTVPVYQSTTRLSKKNSSNFKYWETTTKGCLFYLQQLITFAATGQHAFTIYFKNNII